MPSHRSTSGNSSCPPFGPSAHPRCASAYLWPRLSAVGCLTSVACAGPTMPSADFCGAVREDSSALSPSQDPPQISRGQLSHLLCLDAGGIKYAPAVDGGLCSGVPTRPECTTPRIRFVSLAPHLRSTRPSDPTSRRRPGASLVLRLHKYLDGGLSPPSMTACTAHTPAFRCGWHAQRARRHLQRIVRDQVGHRNASRELGAHTDRPMNARKSTTSKTRPMYFSRSWNCPADLPRRSCSTALTNFRSLL